MPDKFDAFTVGARKAFNDASNIASEYAHAEIEPEHLLLAIVMNPNCMGAKVLEGCNVRLIPLGNVLRFLFRGRIVRFGVNEPRLSDASKKAIELSVNEGTRLGSVKLGTAHLVLGLVREGGYVGEVVLLAGANLEALRLEAKRLLILDRSGD